jgi:hypothetical protein
MLTWIVIGLVVGAITGGLVVLLVGQRGRRGKN